jgi:hypothetical protein
MSGSEVRASDPDPDLTAGADLHFPNADLRVFSWLSALAALCGEIEPHGNLGTV